MCNNSSKTKIIKVLKVTSWILGILAMVFIIAITIIVILFSKGAVFESSNSSENLKIVESSEQNIKSQNSNVDSNSNVKSKSDFLNSIAISENNSKDDKQVFASDKVEEIISQMSLREKICQMIICTPEQLTGYNLVVAAGDITFNALSNYPVGGFIYFAQNLENISQTSEMIENTRQYCLQNLKVPMFFSVDEEGGAVARCANSLGTTSFSPMYNYKNSGNDTAYNNASIIAKDIANIGFNLDFAPVADTWSNKANTVIGTRAYSDDFNQTAELVSYAVKGFNDNNICCVLKHFPGHGDTAEDSHYSSAYSTKTLEQLAEGEYLAFESGISAGADMVMVGHITMQNVDNIPASISPTMITQELRGKLGFNGVVITDSLSMGAVADNYTSGELVVKVVQAGGDIILMPKSLENAVLGLENAVTEGTITEDRINQSLRRILSLKEKRIGFN